MYDRITLSHTSTLRAFFNVCCGNSQSDPIFRISFMLHTEHEVEIYDFKHVINVVSR